MADPLDRLNAALADRLFTRTWPELGRRTLVTGADTVDNRTGFWSTDSRTLFYKRAGVPVIISVPVGLDGAPQPGRQEFSSVLGGALVAFDPKGNRFLVLGSAVGADGPDRPPELDRLLMRTNWLDELRRRMEESR